MSKSDTVIDIYNTPGIPVSSNNTTSLTHVLDNAFINLKSKLKKIKDAEIANDIKNEENLKKYMDEISKEISNLIIINIKSIIENSSHLGVLLLTIKPDNKIKRIIHNKYYMCCQIYLPSICNIRNEIFVPTDCIQLFRQEIYNILTPQVHPHNIIVDGWEIYLTPGKIKKESP